MHGFSSLILSSILSAILPELGLCITDRAFLNVCNVGHDSGQRVQLAWVMLRLLVLVPWAAQAFPCTNTTSISCPTSPTAWQPPNRVHVAIRGEAFRGLTYGGPHKRAHACRGESETIQVAIARAQLLHIVELLERRNIHVDISLHTYSCHDVVNDVAEAQRLEHVLVDAYKHGRDRRVTLRIQPRENLAAHIPVRDAASFAAESAAAAVLIWRFDVIPGAEVRFAPSGTVPFVTYAGDWGLSYPAWFAPCAARIYAAGCYATSSRNIKENLHRLAPGLELRLEGVRLQDSRLPDFTAYREDYSRTGSAICRYLREYGGPPCLSPVEAKQRACERVARGLGGAPPGGISAKRYWPQACTQMICAAGWNCEE